MSQKTIHLIHLSAARPDDVASVIARPEPCLAAHVTHVDVTPDGVDLVLPDASRESAVRLARRLSVRLPEAVVRAQLRVNARWLGAGALLSGSLLTPSHAHVVDVDVPAGVVTRLLETQRPPWTVGVHVQAVGNSSQLVLPGAFETSALRSVTTWVKAHLREPRVSADLSGRWVPNGSRHHDVERFQAGVNLSSVEARLWTDDA